MRQIKNILFFQQTTITLLLCSIVDDYQQFYMSSSKKNMGDLETQPNSPPKPTQPIFINGTSANKRLYEVEDEDKPGSITQKQLLSRTLIKEIIYRGKIKTIKHEIGKIDKQTSLYAKPLPYSSNQFKFDNIPPRNNCYSSLGSAKIKQIQKGLKTRPITLSMKKQSNRYNPNGEAKVQQQEQQEVSLLNQRVSVSGLVTYKFSSVNAERSLASQKINHEQKLKCEIKKANQVRDCQGNRFKKIMLKQSGKRYKDVSRKQRNIMDSLNQSTDQFLQKFNEDNQRETLIYGQKAKKISFIKQYMALEGTDYSEGRHIIDQIERCKPQTHKNPQKRRIKTEKDNEEVAFERRRAPKLDKSLKVGHLTFVE